jgi:hypothetical protein
MKMTKFKFTFDAEKNPSEKRCGRTGKTFKPAELTDADAEEMHKAGAKFLVPIAEAKITTTK